jgi:hypothetical protein
LCREREEERRRMQVEMRRREQELLARIKVINISNWMLKGQSVKIRFD